MSLGYINEAPNGFDIYLAITNAGDKPPVMDEPTKHDHLGWNLKQAQAFELIAKAGPEVDWRMVGYKR